MVTKDGDPLIRKKPYQQRKIMKCLGKGALKIEGWLRQRTLVVE